MNLVDYFKIKCNFEPSLKFGRNRKNNYFKKSLLSQEIYNTKQILPKINNFNSLNTTKRFPDNKKFLSQRTKFPYKINIFNNFIKNDINNVISLKDSYLFKARKEKLKLQNKNNKNKRYEFINSIMSKTDSKDYNKVNKKTLYEDNSNKVKQLRKIINVYYKKDDNENKRKNNSENKIKNKIRTINDNKELNEDGEQNNNNNKNMTKSSMFMTEMNFLIKNKKRKSNKIKIEKIINKSNKNIEKEIKKKIDYDSLTLKELIRHIENNKRRIIRNQNDINKMIKTTRDTYQEIWKINHH